MDSLNSVLIEGTIEGAVETVLKDEAAVCTFTISSNRFYKRAKEYQKEISFFNVMAWGEVAVKCALLSPGQGVRIVGRLWQSNTGAVLVRAEIVESKPESAEKKA